MNREELERHILEAYGVEPDKPWIDSPESEVFRHANNRKWFALIMDISRDKLGLEGTDIVSVVNLKFDPMLGGSLRAEPGIFAAYHMNKEKWITVLLDGSVPAEKIEMLVSFSYSETSVKMRTKSRKRVREE